METSTTFEQVLVVWIIGWGVQKVLRENLNNLPKVHLCMYILRLVPGDPQIRWCKIPCSTHFFVMFKSFKRHGSIVCLVSKIMGCGGRQPQSI